MTDNNNKKPKLIQSQPPKSDGSMVSASMDTSNDSQKSTGSSSSSSSSNPSAKKAGDSNNSKADDNKMDDVVDESNKRKQWEELKGLSRTNEPATHPVVKWLETNKISLKIPAIDAEEVYSWLVKCKIDGETLCSKVEAGVKEERKFTIDWAVPLGLAGGPATKLFNALAPFAQDGASTRIDLSGPIRAEGVKHVEGKQGHEGVDFTKPGKSILMREETVESILDALEREKQLQVRAPPFSGKTSLVQIITRRLLTDPNKKNANIISVSFLAVQSIDATFAEATASGDFKGYSFSDILRRVKQKSSGEWYFVLDEAQRIYDQEGTGSRLFWDWLKKGLGARVHVLVFSAYGGAMWNTPHRFADRTVIYQFAREVEDEDSTHNFYLPGIAPTVEEIKELCLLFQFQCVDGYHTLGAVAQHVLLSMLKTSLPLCRRAIRWLWKQKQDGLKNQYDLDTWACAMLVSQAFVTHMSGAQDRGVPRIADVPAKDRARLQKICDRAVDRLPIEKSEETRELVSRGMLAEVSDEEYHFSSPIVASVYVRQRYECALEGKLPAELEKDEPDISDLVRLLVAGMDPKQLQFGLSNGVGGTPLEALYENEFYRACLKLIPQQYGVCCQIGKTFGVKGMVDIFVNGKFGFGLELLRENNDLKEHRERFLGPEGKYYGLVQNGIIKQYAVIEFRSYKKLSDVNALRFPQFDHVYRVCFNPTDFSKMILVYPNLSNKQIMLSGKQ